MTKIVYNACYGGFNLSEAAILRYCEVKGTDPKTIFDRDIPRTDPALVHVVEELGEKVNTGVSHLKIAELPSGTIYRIHEYDGLETVMKLDDYDWQIA